MIGTAERKRKRAGRGQDLTNKIAETKSFLGKVWVLAKPYFLKSEERGLALTLIGVILAMNFFLVWMSKNLNTWNRDFFTAMQEKDATTFWNLLWSVESFESLFFSFTGLVIVYIVIAVYRLWLTQFLTIRWRRWLTDVYYGDWLRDRTYYRMELSHTGTDNPEQRIEQDVNSFTSRTLSIVLGLISEVATLVTFTVVLWNLSGSITLPVLGGIEVPAYMFWTAILYAILGSYLTYLVGRRLVQVNFALERYNADFRYRMIRTRENAESIALYGGEPQERSKLREAFGRIYETWWQYMTLYKRLTWLTVFYAQVASIFPLVMQAPRYFSGEIAFGVLTQTAGAFAQVQGSLSWFVDNFDVLADWKAVVDRLTGFGETMEEARAQQKDGGLVVQPHDGRDLRIDGVEVRLPNGAPLLHGVDLTIPPGSRLVLQGPSGSGKTTLFRVLAGLWPFGSGQIRTPGGAEVLFVPQKPYMPVGSLREALLYPRTTELGDDEALREALTLCRLEHLTTRLDESANWSMSLSPGEQQRLAFARALLLAPDWLFLDEATSALDPATEERMYRTVIERLPHASIISIAHRPSVTGFHRGRLVIDKEAGTVAEKPLDPSEGGTT
ncbi:ABC transporter ATP-binding protein/permease [Geminicoccus roseus]|uniref:ABC transporter ATP-binding protein/permease n=1 Tax=Geminicoccus roseus TaxID=404900 RepID=UPI000413AD92|nr:ABC transporter ATP-binding protein/permease [Geminicoccus roseus]